jgi:hypothetical protein
VPLPVRRKQACRPRPRTLLLTLVACWLIALAAPAAAQTSADVTPPSGTAAEIAAPSHDGTPVTAVEDPADDGERGADRELVLGLVAVILLGITIGLHALFRDRD